MSWPHYFIGFLKRKEDIKAIMVTVVTTVMGAERGAHTVFTGEPGRAQSFIRMGTMSVLVIAIFPAPSTVFIST